MNKENSFYQASMPGPNGHLSKIRLIEELARMKGSSIAGVIGYSSESGLFILLDYQKRTMYVRVNGGLVCHNNPFDRECKVCFFDGPWFDEVEKYRIEIERNVKDIRSRQRMVLASESLKDQCLII